MYFLKRNFRIEKNTIFEVKNSLDRVNSTMEVIEERLSKRNDPIRQREKRWGKKMNRDSGPVGQYPDGGEREGQKNICRNDWYCPKFGEGYSRFKFTIQGQQILSKINMKKIIPRHITAKLLRTKIKKFLKVVREKVTNYI